MYNFVKKRICTMKNRPSPRILYTLLFSVILLIEILIALFVRDRFIRPYGGDILVTVLLCCLCRIVSPQKPKRMPLYVFLFALCVEIGQYFDFVTLLGLGDNRFFSILLGSTFSFADIICYGIGCILFTAIEYTLNYKKGEPHDRL